MEVYPVESWDGQTGYDWAARPHATHVTMDATEPTTTIDLSTIGTAFLDVETTGLGAFGTYRLVHTVTGASVQDITASSGETVFWNVPVVAGTWRIKDVATGSSVADLILADETPVPIDEIMWPMHSCSNHHGTCQQHKHGYQYESRYRSSNYGSPYDRGNGGGGGGGGGSPSPSPTSQWVGTGKSTEQAAMSFTSEVKIYTITCWDHQVQVDAYVTGGSAAAGGTAGGTKSYTRELCLDFYSQGQPMCMRLENTFQKDTYSDGSQKVYLKDKIGAWNTHFAPCNIAVSKGGNTHKQWSATPVGIEVTENNAGGVYFGGHVGSEAFGMGMGTKVWATGSAQSKVRVEFRPPDSNEHKYTYRFVSGNAGTTGIIGAAWKDY